MEFVVVTVVALVAACLLVTGQVPRGRAAAVLVATALVVAVSVFIRPDAGGADPGLPTPTLDGDFATSSSCRSCHPGEYDSWHASYHRTMTQPATPETVLGDFEVGLLEDRGRQYHLERRGDEFWVELNDPLWEIGHRAGHPDAPQTPQRFWARIVMVTGSHHLQTLWFRRPAESAWQAPPDNGAMFQLPWVWYVEEARWIPTQDSFLSPPSSDLDNQLIWNASCNLCHSVGTQPHIADGQMHSETVELGIACEACHGPGGPHVAANRSPMMRYAAHFTDGRDATIIQPEYLDKERSGEVCGQCHSFHKELDMARWKATGVAFRPGDELGETKAVFKYTTEPKHPRLLEHLEVEPDALDGRFWKDGTMRTTGREYNGLIESACYLRGEMTCLSCHSMHGYEDRSDQLRPGHDGDAACTKCHEDIARDVSAHTNHDVDSAGSSCMNCHMPYTSYGLLTAIRAHRIDVPDADSSARTGRPNACNQCHLDRTLAWTGEHLSRWYGHAEPQLDADQTNVAASVLWALKGDAAQRGVTAWTMGWEAAREASGERWQAAYLSQLLRDPYAAVRQVAFKSLRKLPGFADFEYDFVAPADERAGRSVAAARAWAQRREAVDRRSAAILIGAEGALDVDNFERLGSQRDDTPVRIIE